MTLTRRLPAMFAAALLGTALLLPTSSPASADSGSILGGVLDQECTDGDRIAIGLSIPDPTRELVVSCNVVLDLNGYDLDVRNIVIKSGKTFTVTDSSTDGGTLTADASGTSGVAGIRTTSATLATTGWVHIIAKGGYRAASIGGSSGGAGGTVTIGGSSTVTASGGIDAAAIGGGWGAAGAAVTIGAGASAAVSGPVTFGAGGGGTGFGSLSNAGTLTITSGATLSVPSREEVVNSGTIENYGTLAVPGALINKGKIINRGSFPGIDHVEGRRYLLRLDDQPLLVMGPTIASVGLSLPTPNAPAGKTFKGWYDGDSRVIDSTELGSLFGNAPGMATLEARYIDHAAVTDWDDLVALVNAGTTPIALGGPITAPTNGHLDLPSNTSIALDLAGQRLTIEQPGSGQAAIGVPGTATLTVEDTGAHGELTVTGGYDAAGIGGDNGGSVGQVIVSGATVTAHGGDNAAGLGSGRASTNNASVIIESGTVHATGGYYGAGIGGGHLTDGGEVEIDGGAVVATGGAAGAGIGGGNSGAGAAVTITGGTVTARTYAGDSDNGSGIGAGGGPTSSDGGSLDIRGGTVDATGTTTSPAVGGGGSGAGTAATVAAGAGLTLHGPTAFGAGHGHVATGPGDWGSLANAGTLTVASGSTLTIPTGVEVDNTGTMVIDGVVTGAGTVDNTGRMIGDGEYDFVELGGSGVAIIHHHYRLSFDGSTAGSALDDLWILAGTVADGDETLPTPTGGGRFLGWYTDTGVRVTDTSDLAGPLGDGPVHATLHARFSAPSSVSLSVSPATAVYGQAVRAVATTATPGTVSFRVDGASVGDPTRVAGGTATSGPITGLEPGTHQVTAVLTPDNGSTDGSSATTTLVVDQAATTTTLSITGNQLTATVAPVAPGAGTPTGTVTFSVGGEQIGVAALADGVATLDRALSADARQEVAASYAGDAHFTGSVATTVRDNPSISATVSGTQGKHGWYVGPVTVSYECTETTAPLAEPCPDPITLTEDGAAQSRTATILAIDGGAATAVTSVNIDQTAPTLRLKGAEPGRSYAHAPSVRCVAADRTSGLTDRGCKVTKTTVRKTKHQRRIRYLAVASDRAGNQARSTLVVVVRVRPGRVDPALPGRRA